MNSESACSAEKKSFCVETIPFEDIPSQSSLSLDFLSDSASVREYYQKKSADNFTREVLENYQIDRDALCNILEKANRILGAPGKTLENIDLLRSQDCVAVVTGQQAGLLTGALYTIYKAFSTICLAGDLRQRNISAVPVFWIAEEDHDFDEVKKTFVLDNDGKLVAIANTPRDFKEGSPVGFVELDETIEDTKAELLRSLQNTEFSNALKELLSETYREKETYSDAFAKFLTKIFGKYGLIILTPLNEDLKRLSSPIFVEAVKKSDEIRTALLARTKELEANKYFAQVLVEKDFFPFFLIDGKKRFALKKNESGSYQVKGTKQEFSLTDLVELAEREPQKLSPNALMRPIVQDFLLPTATYFGGAAEIAYFAQNAEIYRILKRPLTPIRHRASLTIIEPKNRRTLEKYALKLPDLFAGQKEVSARIVNEFLANEMIREFNEVEETIDRQLSRLDNNLKAAEPSLSANLATRRRKILYHIHALTKKFQRSEIQKDETLRRRIEFLFISLLPHKALQERTLNITYFLNLYGENFIDWVYDAVKDEEKEHQILYL